MSQPSGAHASTCRYCGKRYQLTNWMKRKNLGRDDQGRLLGDTHQAACWNSNSAADNLPSASAHGSAICLKCGHGYCFQSGDYSHRCPNCFGEEFKPPPSARSNKTKL